MLMKSRAPIANSLLAALSHAEFQRILVDLTPVTLKFGEVLYEPGDAINYVYFPNDALISLLTQVDQNSALEVGMVGREGMAGIALALDMGTTPFRTIVQGGGTAFRMEHAPFRNALARSLPLQHAVHLYLYALLTQIAQTAACNRFHVVEARLARWLLMTRDRACSNHFQLTHEFLAHMLGVRRAGVTKAAYELKNRQLINYSRGHIEIIDAGGLEAAACSCYEVGKTKLIS